MMRSLSRMFYERMRAEWYEDAKLVGLKDIVQDNRDPNDGT